MTPSTSKPRGGVYFAGLLAFAGAVLWTQAGRGGPQEVEVPPRQKALENFPCQECHVNIDEANSGVAPRTKTHSGMRFLHMDKIEQCNLCHPSEDMDTLRLVDGRTVTFNESYQLCGQCHGEKLGDWKKNLHGKQVGSWRALAHRYSCVDCHEPHSPRLPKMKAVPPPPRPPLSIPKEERH